MKSTHRRTTRGALALLGATMSLSLGVSIADDGKTITIDGFEGPAIARGVSDATLGGIQLKKEIPAIGNRRLRMRIVTIEPDGIVPLHGHADRPAIFYVLQGQIEEHRNTRDSPVELARGDVSVETNVVHWWENTESEPAILLVSDLVIESEPEPGDDRVRGGRLDGPGEPVAYSEEVLASMDLATQFERVVNREFRLRVVTVHANGVVPVHPHMDRPALFFVVEGEIDEYRSDETSPVTRRKGSFLKAEDGVLHWWKNSAERDVVILVADIANTARSSSGEE